MQVHLHYKMSSHGIVFAVLALSGICAADPLTAPIAGPLIVPAQQLSPKSYEFGFEFGDGLGMKQHRREVADGTGAVKGSYGYLDPLGVNRIVEYMADGEGYRAVVRSNEPGTASHSAADVAYLVQPPPAAAVAEGLRSSLPKIVF